MAVQPWGEWRPDVSSYQGQHSPTITNVYPRGDGYGPVPSYAALSDALPGTCRGFFTAFDDDGTVAIFAGTSTRLYRMSNTTYAWLDVSQTDATKLTISGLTSIGDLTGGGNLAAAFDADTTHVQAACATKAAATTAYVGKTFTTPTAMRSAKIYGSTDAGYVSAINPTVTAKLYAKQGTAPGSGTDGTEIGTLSFTDTADEQVARTITSTDLGTLWDHVWVYITHNGAANTMGVAELELFGADDYTTIAGSVQWQFAQFGTDVIAVHGGVNPQRYTMGSSSIFADLAGSPPQAAYVTVINEFLVLSGLTSQPFRVQWSARSVITGWTAGTDESDFQDFQDGGLVRGVAGGEFGVVFQDNVVRRMTYAPGTAFFFEFDRISEDMGLLGPYSLVRVRDSVFFLSQHGFQMWNPMTGFKPIGKEKVDRTFTRDWDANIKQLLIGANDPNATRILWAYKSMQGAPDLFDRIITYDWMLDRWAGFINVQGEYIASGANPGVTLENLDSISSSIDALSVSLDDFPTGFANNVAVANSSHVIGLLSGPNMQAILESPDTALDGGRRKFCRGVRPLTDAQSVYSSVSVRKRLADQVMYGTEAPMNANGFAPHRTDTGIARYRNRFPASQDWTFSIGVDPETVPTGLR
jgi:hypothetical protein